MVVLMVEIHAYASYDFKALSLAALIFMGISVCITCSLHYTVLTVSDQIESITCLPWITLFFGFKWPSAAYALDILSWDLFFSLSMLF